MLVGFSALLVLWAFTIVVSVEAPEPLGDVINELLSDSVNVQYASTVISIQRSLSNLHWETRVLLVLALVMAVLSIRVCIRALRVGENITTRGGT